MSFHTVGPRRPAPPRWRPVGSTTLLAMAEPFIAAPRAKDRITRLLKLEAKIWTQRNQELDRV